MSWRWVSIAAFLGALVMAYGIFVGRGTLDRIATEAPPQPGYYLNDAIITETQPDGAPGMQLIARRIEQQPDDSFVLNQVRVEYLKIPDQAWHLTAERGLVPADSRIVQFSGNVNLHPSPFAGDQTGLRTDALAIDTEKHIAYNIAAPVTVHFGNHVLTAKAFQADLVDRKIRLESVNGRLDPG